MESSGFIRGDKQGQTVSTQLHPKSAKLKLSRHCRSLNRESASPLEKDGDCGEPGYTDQGTGCAPWVGWSTDKCQTWLPWSMDCPRGDSANPTDPPDSGRIEIGPIGYIHSWKIRNSEDLATEKFSRDASYDILVKSDCISWPTTGNFQGQWTINECLILRSE